MHSIRRFLHPIQFCMVLLPCSAGAHRESAESPQLSSEAVPVDMIRIQGFRITGNTIIKTDELAPIVDPYAGRSVGLTELQQVADRITEEYRARGYGLAKAYLPQQEIRDGVVEVAVLEGTLGDIIVEGNQHYSESFIRDGFSRMQRRRHPARLSGTIIAAAQ